MLPHDIAILERLASLAKMRTLQFSQIDMMIQIHWISNFQRWNALELSFTRCCGRKLPTKCAQITVQRVGQLSWTRLQLPLLIAMLSYNKH